MRDLFIQFRKSENGATLVEYGVALILAIVLGGGALVSLANQTGTNMGAGCTALQANGVVSANC
ncbi:MAG: Flp family type IVb pilin [Silicimonas sp.]|nr:Flp family type IVb pilin [Silicimonas sp.]